MWLAPGVVTEPARSGAKTTKSPPAHHWPQLPLLLMLLASSLVKCQEPNYNYEQDDESWQAEAGELERPRGPLQQQSAVESLLGQLAKTVVYSGASVARLNNRLLCNLLRRETGRDNEEQPTLFLFRSSLNKDHAFRLYSDDEITHQLMEEAQLDPRQATVILVHGWLGGVHNEYWLSEAKNVALKSGDELSTDEGDRGAFGGRQPLGDSAGGDSQQDDDALQQYRPNVIVVDWSEFAHGSLYTATQNSYKVARRLGRLLEQLASKGGLRAELMHCLGHSIGAHICGQAARHAFGAQPQPARTPALLAQRRRMGRITALDPGGFCYELGIRNESSYLGLRPSDALLTDAYYSNRSPFGNRFQVAQYNVRLSNGYFQGPCSVWRNSSVAAEYFRASVRFALGNIGHNDVLTCDHYFATRFAHQAPSSERCSYVAYACDNYRNFVRGRCGACERTPPSRHEQPLCYPMDFEYQRSAPSNRHALEHIQRHSSLLLQQQQSAPDRLGPPGAMAYSQRRPYYMRVSQREPYCAHTYRVRLELAPDIQQLDTFKASAVQLQLLGVVTMRDSSSGKLTGGVLSLHGPWPSAIGEDHDQFGLTNRTLTAMFELTRPERIRGLLVNYDNERNRHHIPRMQLVDSVHFDYLSSTDPQVRAKFSSWFDGSEIDVEFKRLGGGGGGGGG